MYINLFVKSRKNVLVHGYFINFMLVNYSIIFLRLQLIVLKWHGRRLEDCKVTSGLLLATP